MNQSKQEKQLYTDNEKEKYLMKVDTDIDFSSVILSKANKEKIIDFVNEIRNSKKLKKFNLKPMNRLLFYGASGCGKTFLAKALSNYLDYQMLYVAISKTFSSGNPSVNLNEIFSYAKRNDGNFIIFLDEVDSIAWARDSENPEGGDIRRATNTLFQLMDQMDYTNIVIGATNLLHRLDPAFERRFDMKLEFKRPNVSIAETVEKFLFPNFELIKDIEDSVTERRSVLSFAEYQGIAEKVMKRAVLSNTVKIRMSTVYKEVGKLMNIKVGFGTDTDNFYNPS